MPIAARIVSLLFIIAALFPDKTVSAQDGTTRPPVEMMVLIDNSCSMFPASQILPGCDAYGSDESFLRIAGANLFIARLGFGEINEAGYQLGVISIGDEPELISSLQPLKDRRDALAELIAKPKAQPATRIVPALELAYSQLKASTNPAPRTQAVVMITDGVPWPPEEQSNEVIKDLVTGHSETPLFIMLLQNKERVSQDYESYIQFWEELQRSNHHIFVYRLRQAGEIQSTYNAILGQLQNSIPAEAADLNASDTLNFTVSEYLDRLVITIIRPTTRTDAGVTITDGNNQPVKISDEGVDYFQGQENPVDVYSIQSSRLDQGGRGKVWNVKTRQEITVLIDREGSYRFNFLSPEASSSSIANVFSILDRQSPNVELKIRFNLITNQGDVVLAAQNLTGTIIMPDGSSQEIDSLEGIKPDPAGTYEFGINLPDYYPRIETIPGRFTLILNAGISDELQANSPPVTSARLQLDAGKLPFIRSVAPLPVDCEPGQPGVLRVNIGDYESAQAESIRVNLVAGDNQVNLEQSEPGIYSTDVSALCAELVQNQTCSLQETYTWNVQLDAELGQGIPMQPEVEAIQVEVMSPQCTLTPVPTLTPTPTPEPTPLPDTDQDGIVDTADRCPEQRGWSSTGGCIPWVNLAAGLGILGLIVFSSRFFYSLIKVNTFGNPPQGFLTAERDGEVVLGPIDLHQRGMKKRASSIKIGGSKRNAHIHIPGLKPVEFIIERKSVVTYVRDPQVKEGFAFLSDKVEAIYTSDPRLVLKVSSDREALTTKPDED